MTPDLFPEATSQLDGEFANDRYTPEPLLRWCLRQAHVVRWDLDVAACREAHCARRWYDREHDGLTSSWLANWDDEYGRVWCNPPWDDVTPWVAKAWDEMAVASINDERMVIGMLLPGNRQEQPWWQDLVEPYREQRHLRVVARIAPAGVTLSTHYPPGRQPFGVPGNPQAHGRAGVPFPVVLLVWRNALT